MGKGLGNTPRFLLLCGILAPALMATVIFICGRITPDYSPISDTISQMGVPGKPYAFLLNGGYAFYGILVMAAAIGLYQTLTFTPIAGRVAISVGLHGLFTILLGVFTDVPDIRQRFTAHIVHDVVSILSYAPLMAGIIFFRKLAREDITLKTAGVLGMVIMTVSLFSPAFTLLEPFRPVSGLLQRITAGFAFFWIGLVFFLLYRRRQRLYGGETSSAISK